jgi:cyclophilin family peptidyl-prolyl cis-trans isomerase
MAMSTADAERRLVRTMVLAILLLLAPPPSSAQSPQTPEVFQVRFETTQGAFVVEAHPDWAPQGVARFRELVASRYFDDSRFFRVVAKFIAQFGIAGDPEVTAAWKERTIPDDPPGKSRHSNLRGTLAFAMTGPGTRSTQIYINLADNSRLDAQGFAPIGRIVSGMDVVDRLYAGYGEGAGGGMRGGRQGKMLAGGNAYLDASFPKLDHLVRARVVAGR